MKDVSVKNALTVFIFERRTGGFAAVVPAISRKTGVSVKTKNKGALLVKAVSFAQKVLKEKPDIQEDKKIVNICKKALEDSAVELNISGKIETAKICPFVENKKQKT